MRKVLSIYLPNWPSDRVRRRLNRARTCWPAESSPAVLLVTELRGQRWVAHGCAMSASRGIRPGMSLPCARALLGDRPVVVEPYDPAADRAGLGALSQWAMQFSPVVAQDPPDGLLMDIEGCQRLWGDERTIGQRVMQAIERLGFSVRGAVGPTVGCAWAVSRYGPNGSVVSMEKVREVLDPLPVAALRLEEEILQALHAVAVDRVSQLLALPRAQLAERFGAQVGMRVDQALGRVHEPVEPCRPREPVQVEREFPGPVVQMEGMMLATRELLEQLAGELQSQEAGLRKLLVEMKRVDAQSVYEQIELARPCRDVAHLWKLLSPRLERVNLGWGIEKIILTATLTGKLAHRQQVILKAGRVSEAPSSPGPQFEADQGREAHAAEMIDLLVNRLGEPRVRCFEPVESHVPERAFVSRPAAAALEPAGKIERFIPADRPSVLYARPQPVEVVSMAPEGPVVSMRLRREWVRVIQTIGPERLTPRWWLVSSDTRKPPPRDLFKVQDEQGRWWWIFRQVGTGRWYVHGRWV